jgi:hypothetical protein
MLKLAYSKKTYAQKVAEYMESEEYKALPQDAKQQYDRKTATTLIVNIKRNLRAIREELGYLYGEQKETMQELKEVESKGIDGGGLYAVLIELKDNIDLWESKRNKIGTGIMMLVPHWQKVLTEDDMRSLFNVSYEDMQQVKEQCEGRTNLLDFLFMSWWAGDTVELFGQAMFFGVRSNEKASKLLDEATEDLLLSFGQPVQRYNVTYDKYGDVATAEPAGALLKRIK